MRLHERIHAMRQRSGRLSLRDRLRRRRRIVELALSKSVPTERLKAAHTTRPPSRLVIAAGLKLVAVPIDSARTRRSLASGSRARLPTPAEPERVAPVSASRSGPVPPGGGPRNGAGKRRRFLFGHDPGNSVFSALAPCGYFRSGCRQPEPEPSIHRGKRILWAGRWQGCFTAFRASPRRGILARTGTILSVADFAGFDARGRRGCLCDGWASLGADAPGRRSQQHQSPAVNHSGTASRSSLARRDHQRKDDRGLHAVWLSRSKSWSASPKASALRATGSENGDTFPRPVDQHAVDLLGASSTLGATGDKGSFKCVLISFGHRASPPKPSSRSN